jgi:hypothetical protein
LQHCGAEIEEAFIALLAVAFVLDALAGRFAAAFQILVERGVPASQL